MKFLPVFSEDLSTLVFFIVFAYLLGSIPFGIIWAKVFKLGSLKDIGSGNIGATNVLRTGKKYLAVLTLFLDSLKGYAAVFITTETFQDLYLYSAFFCLFIILRYFFPF